MQEKRTDSLRKAPLETPSPPTMSRRDHEHRNGRRRQQLHPVDAHGGAAQVHHLRPRAAHHRRGRSEPGRSRPQDGRKAGAVQHQRLPRFFRRAGNRSDHRTDRFDGDLQRHPAPETLQDARHLRAHRAPVLGGGRYRQPRPQNGPEAAGNPQSLRGADQRACPGRGRGHRGPISESWMSTTP